MNTAWDDIDQWDSWWSAQQFEWKLVCRYYEVCIPREGIEIRVEMNWDVHDESDSRPPHRQECWRWSVSVKDGEGRPLFVEVSGLYDDYAEPLMTRDECKKDAIFYCTRHLPHELKGGLMEAKKKTVDLAEAISILGLEVKTGGREHAVD